MFRRISAAASAALLILASTPAFGAEAPGRLPTSSWIAIPSGVADPDSQSIYVTGASETLTALDLETGEQRWECKEAQLPLAVAGDRVIARTSQNKLPPNAMQLVVLDGASSKVQMRCEQIVFPEWVAVGGGLGLYFDAVASVEDNILTITWYAARELAVAQGKATPEMIASAKKTTTGTVEVDLETGKNRVSVDPAPRKLTLNRKLPFYDVGDKRLNITQRTEKIEGGVHLVHRMLEARDHKTGKPVWQQPIAGEVYLPVGPPPEVSRRPGTKSPTRR
jgi:hypothetical protein